MVPPLLLSKRHRCRRSKPCSRLRGIRGEAVPRHIVGAEQRWGTPGVAGAVRLGGRQPCPGRQGSPVEPRSRPGRKRCLPEEGPRTAAWGHQRRACHGRSWVVRHSVPGSVRRKVPRDPRGTDKAGRLSRRDCSERSRSGCTVQAGRFCLVVHLCFFWRTNTPSHRGTRSRKGRSPYRDLSSLVRVSLSLRAPSPLLIGADR